MKNPVASPEKLFPTAAVSGKTLLGRKTDTRTALLSRELDFWLLGGASLAIWLGMYLLNSQRNNWAIGHHFDNLAALSATLVLLINYPHFMASYQIAYSRGWRFIVSKWPQLIAAPTVLLVWLAVAFAFFTDPQPFSFVSKISSARAGEGLASLAVGFMFISVGWHYSKQIFGCMMVYSAFDGYSLDSNQRRVLRFLLHSIWWVNFANAQIGSGPANDFYGIPLLPIDLPYVCKPLATGGFLCLLAAFLFSVVWKKWREDRVLPSICFLVPLVAFAAWWLPVLNQPDFYFFLAPLFHSLQYLPFAIRHERSRRRESEQAPKGMSLEVVSLVVVGFLSFELIPHWADVHLKPANLGSIAFFMAAAHVFINVHHYFIDSAIWRFDQREVRRFLLQAESAGS